VDLRGLKALVAGLGILVVLGTAVVIGVIIKRLYASPAPPSIAGAPPADVALPDAGAAFNAPVLLPAGSRIAGIAAAGGDFAVTVTGPAGDQVWVLNPQTGAHVVALSAPPGNNK